MTTENLPSFKLPELIDNEAGWGPSDVPENINNIPFAPFNKADRLGRISDWTQSGNNNNRNNNRGRFNNQFGAGAGQFNYKHEDDESSFSLVDNRPKPKNKFGRRPFQQRRTNNWNNNRRRWNNNRGGKNGKDKWGYNRRRWGYNNYNQQPDNKDPSVEISEDWECVNTIEFSELQKLKYSPDEAKNLVECGELEKYNNDFDRVSPKIPKALQRFEKRQHFTATTSEDPVLKRLAAEKVGNVYATDTILGLLMACTRSVNPWDILVKKKDGVVWLDKRRNSDIDFLTVNENWNEVDQKQDKDSVNHPKQLAREATLINHNFSQQILSQNKDGEIAERMKFAEKNPFENATSPGNEPASMAYRYRKFTMESTDGKPINLIARCAVNGYAVSKSGEKLLMTARALNQFDAKCSGNVEWKQKLEQQIGAVLATEMKNNTNKLARWVAEAVLNGSEEFRLGFVTRVHEKNAFKHSVLMTKRFKPESFAQSVSVKITNLWASLRHIISACQALEDGSFLLFRDPNKAEMHFVEVPENAFAGETGVTE